MIDYLFYFVGFVFYINVGRSINFLIIQDSKRTFGSFDDNDLSGYLCLIFCWPIVLIGLMAIGILLHMFMDACYLYDTYKNIKENKNKIFREYY